MNIREKRELSAYEKQTVHEMFRMNLAWLEKYIEVYYPAYHIKKQIHDNYITRKDANNPKAIEGLCASSLFGFKVSLEIVDKPKFLCEELKEEYYKWLDAAEINANNCPARLKHFFFEINEILEGRGDKLEKDIENRKWKINPDSVEYEEAMEKLFSSLPTLLAKEEKKEQSMVGKKHQKVKCDNNFSGKKEIGEQIFQQITKDHDYQDFHFLPQKTSQDVLEEQTSDRFQRRPNALVIRDVKKNPLNWKIAEIVVGKAEKEIALIHKGAEINDSGEVCGSQPVYLGKRFNQEEKNEINKYLNIPATNASWSFSHEPLNQKSKFIQSQKDNSGLVYFLLLGGAILLIGIVIHLVVKLKKKVCR